MPKDDSTRERADLRERADFSCCPRCPHTRHRPSPCTECDCTPEGKTRAALPLQPDEAVRLVNGSARKLPHYPEYD
jgi:hypothetical protein